MVPIFNKRHIMRFIKMFLLYALSPYIILIKFMITVVNRGRRIARNIAVTSTSLREITDFIGRLSKRYEISMTGFSR